MPRLHFYVMGLIALAFGLVSMAEYVMISFGTQAGWLDFYPQAQLDWLASVPGWVHAVWGAHATLALVGALCLLAHLRPAVWMLAFAFLSLLVLAIWSVAFASPSVLTLVENGTNVLIFMGLALVLNFLIYLYARQEKRVGEVL